MLTLDLNEGSKFQFQLEITGDNDTGAKPIVEFKIVTPELSLSFPTKFTGSVFEVAIPKLANIVPSGKYSCELCVIMGDRYFVPLTEQVELKQPTQAVVSNFTPVNQPTEAVPTVKVTKVTEAVAPPAAFLTFQRKSLISR